MARARQAAPQQASEFEVLRRHIEQHGLKMTSQRRKILEVFLRLKGHFTSEELYARVKRVDPRVGYTTVYRTLRLLSECGLAEERHFKDGLTRFEQAHARRHHDHLVCMGCGKITEFRNDSIEKLQRQVAQENGFELLDHRHEMYGRCADCRQK